MVTTGLTNNQFNTGLAPIHYASFELNDAAIKNWPTTPVEIAEEQADCMILFKSAFWLMSLTSAGYGAFADFTVAFTVGIYTVSSAYVETTQGAFASPGSAGFDFLPAQLADTQQIAAAWSWDLSSVNQPLLLSATNGLSAPLTGGNAANYVKGIAEYRILDLTTLTYV